LEHFSDHFDHAEDMLIHFPPAPRTVFYPGNDPRDRKVAVLANGATHGSVGYNFRAWAYEQDYVTFAPHAMNGNGTPKGQKYIEFLSQYGAALALCSVFPVPKYMEIPAAGCLTFAQYHKDYEDLGFKDYETCVYVNKDNFEERVKDYLAAPGPYTKIAAAGTKLVADNYTADKFAEFLYKKLETVLP
jgi:spore maturation protein CgeB